MDGKSKFLMETTIDCHQNLVSERKAAFEEIIFEEVTSSVIH